MPKCGTKPARRIVETALLRSDEDIVHATEAVFAKRLVLLRRHGPRRHRVRYYMSWYWRITTHAGQTTITRARSFRGVLPDDGSTQYAWSLVAHTKCPTCLARL